MLVIGNIDEELPAYVLVGKPFRYPQYRMAERLVCLLHCIEEEPGSVGAEALAALVGAGPTYARRVRRSLFA